MLVSGPVPAVADRPAVADTPASRSHPAAPGPVLLPSGDSGGGMGARFFRAPGDPARLRLLEFLLPGDPPVTECVARVRAVTGRRERRHSGKPSIRRHARKPLLTSSRTASSAYTQYGPRQ